MFFFGDGRVLRKPLPFIVGEKMFLWPICSQEAEEYKYIQWDHGSVMDEDMEPVL